jgi:hypothetical protein
LCRGVGDPLADRQQRGCPGQYGTRRQREHDPQAVAHAARTTGVGYLVQPLQQARNLIGYNLGLLAELVKGMRDRR